MDNIRVVWGTDHKVGTTMLSQSMTEIIADTGKDTVLLTLGTNPGDDFFNDGTSSVETIRTRLSCGLLTKDNIRRCISGGNKYCKLNGLSDLKKMHNFTPEMIKDLIDITQEVFEEIVIDCGTGTYNPLCLTALSYCRNSYFIFTQQESSIRSWNRCKEYLRKARIVPKIAVVNRYFKGDNYTLSYMAKRTGLALSIFKTITESDFGIQAEEDRKTLLYYGDKKYEKDVQNLMN